MLYDKHPIYSFQQDSPYAREPLKRLYVLQRLITTILLVPCWVIYYGLLPKSHRPRPSWSIKQIITVNFVRRIHKVTEVAGVTWGTRNPEDEEKGRLKETRFQWVEPLRDELANGIVKDEQVPIKKVGVYVWPKDPSAIDRNGGSSSVSSSISRKEGKKCSISLNVQHATSDLAVAESGLLNRSSSSVIGIFFHGGGYVHMSAHERAGTSRIPRRLIKDKICTEVYAVEYRLLQHASVPGAIQDGASVYAHIALNVLGATKGSGGIYHYQNSDSSRRPKVVLIGDSAGGNLVLGLTRWIRDEGMLPMPDGLILCSPSCDPSHAFPYAPSSYVPRPHERTDYLVDTPEPRALLQKTFLGHHPLETIHSPYLSPASPRVLCAYGHRVDWEGECGDYGPVQLRAVEAGEGSIGLVTAVPLPHPNPGKGDNDETKLSSNAKEDSDHMQKLSGSNHESNGVGMQDGAAKEDTEGEAKEDGDVDGAMDGRSLSFANCRVTEIASRASAGTTQTYLNPMPANPAHRTSLFADFPPSFVLIGDAERLAREVALLTRAMHHDGVSVHVHVIKDAVHDCLMLKWWDEKERNKAWSSIKDWTRSLTSSG